MERIAISLAGHTNNGKTTLARTLLRKDVGVVDDRPHVTDIADGHVLERDEHAEIVLWDLPGFGDSVRLKKRLGQTGIFAWFQTVFDRWTDRPLWCSQKCLENVKDHADAVLYLVEAGADPASSPEVRAELEVLAEIGKPVILLLNQTGIPDQGRDASLAQGWLDSLENFTFVRGALPLDGWMRCWVQESVLFQHVASILPAEKQQHFKRLIDAWKRKNHDGVFAESIHVLVRALAETAAERVIVDKESIVDKVGSALSRKPSEQVNHAQAILTESLVKRSRNAMGQLLKINHLEGAPKDRVDSMIQGLRANNADLPPEIWAVMGAIGTGVLGGLIADLHAGGMTFGGGAVAGGLLGGVAAYTLGRGYRKIKGEDGLTRLQWSEDFLIDEWKASGMRYLTIAHFGRGKGNWQDPLDESLPKRWKELIDSWVENWRSEVIKALNNGNPEMTHELLSDMIRTIFSRLYPTAITKDHVSDLGPTNSASKGDIRARRGN